MSAGMKFRGFGSRLRTPRTPPSDCTSGSQSCSGSSPLGLSLRDLNLRAQACIQRIDLRLTFCPSRNSDNLGDREGSARNNSDCDAFCSSTASRAARYIRRVVRYFS
jgi:hypothetical protein